MSTNIPTNTTNPHNGPVMVERKCGHYSPINYTAVKWLEEDGQWVEVVDALNNSKCGPCVYVRKMERR